MGGPLWDCGVWPDIVERYGGLGGAFHTERGGGQMNGAHTVRKGWRPSSLEPEVPFKTNREVT